MTTGFAQKQEIYSDKSVYAQDIFSAVSLTQNNNIRYIMKKSIREHIFIENIGEAKMHTVIVLK
ncbi:MAG TPA: hypothetical protein VF047_06245 [Nitrososphaeraceae archaeon]